MATPHPKGRQPAAKPGSGARRAAASSKKKRTKPVLSTWLTRHIAHDAEGAVRINRDAIKRVCAALRAETNTTRLKAELTALAALGLTVRRHLEAPDEAEFLFGAIHDAVGARVAEQAAQARRDAVAVRVDRAVAGSKQLSGNDTRKQLEVAAPVVSARVMLARFFAR